MKPLTRTCARALLICGPWGAASHGETVREFLWAGAAAIPNLDPAGLALDFDVPAAPETIVSDVDVGLVVSHTWQGDLHVELRHLPSGRAAVLVDRPGAPQQFFGFSADNFGDPVAGVPFWSDDEGPTPYDVPFVAVPGIASPTGAWQPDTSPLSSFDGIDATGAWRVTLIDAFGAQDVGHAQNVTLRLTTVPEPASLLGVLLAARFVVLHRPRQQRRA